MIRNSLRALIQLLVNQVQPSPAQFSIYKHFTAKTPPTHSTESACRERRVPPQLSFSDMAHPPPYEPFYLAAPPPEYLYTANDVNGINTLFVSGLPDDVKAREIHNLFRRRPGFESCQLKYTGRGNQVLCHQTNSFSPIFLVKYNFCMNKLNYVIPSISSLKSVKQLDFFQLFIGDYMNLNCQLFFCNSQVVAFATFVNHQSAMAALHSLNVSCYLKYSSIGCIFCLYFSFITICKCMIICLKKNAKIYLLVMGHISQRQRTKHL